MAERPPGGRMAGSKRAADQDQRDHGPDTSGVNGKPKVRRTDHDQSSAETIHGYGDQKKRTGQACNHCKVRPRIAHGGPFKPSSAD